jgi:capsular exopolysaccharide synthesis family protein
LSREPYPGESIERREPEPRTGSEPGNTPETANPPLESTLFERLDARLTEKIVVDHNMSPASREQYRRLAAVLHDAHNTTGMRVIMVASAVAGEGKTLTASNLALTFSESYQKRVLLIDADLRRPSLHTVFRLETALGLGDGLISPGDSKMLVRQVSQRLAVLPAGRPSSDPMAGLTSARMRKLLEEARESFDWVILDTPPVMLLPDAHLLASMVEGAVLVVRAGSTPHELVKRAADAIGRSRILGVVLNRAELQGRHEDEYHYYGYSERGGTEIARL